MLLLLLSTAPAIAYGGAGRTSATQQVPHVRLVDAADHVLRALPLPKDTQLTLTPIGQPLDAMVPAGEVRLVVGQEAGRWPRSRVAVPIQVQVNGRTVRTTSIWFAVSAEHSTIVFADDLAQGIQAAQVRTRSASIDLAAVDGSPVTSIAQVAGERLKHRVQAGAPVLAEDFEPVPDVDRQQAVTVVVDSGAVRLQTGGTALTAGNTGQRVRVLAHGADAPVMAEVTARGVVHVER
jgi:flagella basal body P-ring formation protein FlgA